MSFLAVLITALSWAFLSTGEAVCLTVFALLTVAYDKYGPNAEGSF